jgi:hypothetical protein
MQTCLAIAFSGFKRHVFPAFEIIVKRPLRNPSKTGDVFNATAIEAQAVKLLQPDFSDFSRTFGFGTSRNSRRSCSVCEVV